MKENKKPPRQEHQGPPPPPPPRRIAVIVSPGQATWASCHTIGTNLRFSYELAQAKMGGSVEFDYLNYGDDLSDRQLTDLAQKILEKKYSHVSFIDHWPPAFGLVRALAAISMGRKLPAILIHVYGDFTFLSTDMVSTFFLLNGQNVRPLCASHRQIGLISELLNTTKGSIGYCPFPVNPDVFFPDSSLRAEERRALGWGDDEFVLLYTGRVSLQKNVTLAISEFFNHLHKGGGKKWKGRFRFAYAGKYDDMGAPFFGNMPPLDEYFFRIRKIIESIDPALGTVSYLGDLEPSKLNRVYNAADAFISLSVHHDEDYGMSPAEALACGLPCILSDWGGYSSFAEPNTPAQKQVWLVPVGIDKTGPHLAQPILSEAFSDLLASRRSPEERLAAAQKFRSGFDLEAVADKLVQEIGLAETSSVSGATPVLLELAKRSIECREGRATRIYKSYSDPLYKKIYSVYYGPLRK